MHLLDLPGEVRGQDVVFVQDGLQKERKLAWAMVELRYRLRSRYTALRHSMKYTVNKLDVPTSEHTKWEARRLNAVDG